ncbi:hypothetical protein [uncultured Azohydromonas sp.]|jgi:hypothetical protein|uniref:hypothetical protein n=1 Tax=uncultured Azohydromonas sp. TaxID=487342 RepID=UPI0026193AC7|nr:hypothetical protein [uncultured Azohydromonas sp.]
MNDDLNASKKAAPGRGGLLPRWACLALAALCAGLGGWASVVTLRYFEFGARALEADEAARALASTTALLLVVLEMAAFALAALLPRQRLRAQRWGLAVLAVSVLAFECLTIVLVQQGITRAADVGAEARQQRVIELRASITALRATAEELRNAAAASSQSKVLASRQSAAESLNAALETERLVQARTAELAELQAALRPTTTQILGEQGALAYSVTRGLLVSVAGLVLFGAAGSLLRAAGEGATPVGVSAAAPVSMSVVPDVSGAVSGVSVPVAPGRIGASFALAAVPLAAGATVPLQVVPGGDLQIFSQGGWVPSPRSKPAAAPLPGGDSGVSEGVIADRAADVPGVAVGVSADVSGGVAGVSVAVREAAGAVSAAVARDEVEAVEAPAAVVPAADEPAASGAEDTPLPAADSAGADARLERVRAGVRDGTIAPSIRGVQAAVRCGAPMVRRYLAQLEAEGLIRRTERGYERVVEREPWAVEA